MAWYDTLWPWGQKSREKQITAEFEAHLKEAYERHGDIDDIVKQLREDREEPPLQGNDNDQQQG
jgi:hypothetical protein